MTTNKANTLGHIHAELMVQYATDATATDKPWLLWEYYDSFDYEIPKAEADRWHTCRRDFHFHPDMKFRRKQAKP